MRTWYAGLDSELIELRSTEILFRRMCPGIVGEFREGTTFEERLRFNTPSQSPLSYIRSVYDTNVFGVIAVTQAMLPLLRECPAGRIVNMGSSVGSLTLNAAPDAPYRSIFGAAYSPSKTALSATTLAFAIELEKTNIKVNVVCRGFVATDLNDFRGQRTVEQGAKQAVKMTLIGPDGPIGTFTDEDGTNATLAPVRASGMPVWVHNSVRERYSVAASRRCTDR